MFVAAVIALTYLIGYSVSFTYAIAGPVWFASTLAGFWYKYRHVVRDNAQVRKDVQSYVAIISCQLQLTFIYPIYAYVFASLSPCNQTAFVLLPCIKIAVKNWISYWLGNLDDLKPEFVIFHVDIFNALYVSLCMQNSTSLPTNGALMAVDFVQAWLSFHDMKSLVRDLKALIAKMPVPKNRGQLTVIEVALTVIESDASVSRHASFQVQCQQSESLRKLQAAKLPRTESSKRSLGSKRAVVTPERPLGLAKAAAIPKQLGDTSTAIQPVALTASLPPNQGRAMEKTLSTELGLSRRERLEFIQKAVKVLYMIEFHVLIEYTKVVTPRLHWVTDELGCLPPSIIIADFSFQFKWLSQ